MSTLKSETIFTLFPSALFRKCDESPQQSTGIGVRRKIFNAVCTAGYSPMDVRQAFREPTNQHQIVPKGNGSYLAESWYYRHMRPSKVVLPVLHFIGRQFLIPITLPSFSLNIFVNKILYEPLKQFYQYSFPYQTLISLQDPLGVDLSCCCCAENFGGKNCSPELGKFLERLVITFQESWYGVFCKICEKMYSN